MHRQPQHVRSITSLLSTPGHPVPDSVQNNNMVVGHHRCGWTRQNGITGRDVLNRRGSGLHGRQLTRCHRASRDCSSLDPMVWRDHRGFEQPVPSSSWSPSRWSTCRRFARSGMCSLSQPRRLVTSSCLLYTSDAADE